MIRLALIDVGGRCSDYCAALPHLHGATITSVVDADSTIADKVAAQVGAQTTAHSWVELPAAAVQSIDAVVVHSPLPRRQEIVCQAAAAGKHVLVDTPLAESSEAAQGAIEACTSASVHLMVGQPMRFMPYQRTIRESLEAGKLGTAGLVRLHHWHPEKSESIDRSTSQAVMDLAVHEVDIACWLFEAFPNFVYARSLSGITPQQGLQLHLGFPAGGMALIDCTRSLPANSDPYYSLTLIGSTGAAYADDHRNTNLLLRSDCVGLKVSQGHDYFARQLQEFVDAVKHDRTPNGTGEDGKRAIAVMLTAIESLQSRRAAKRVGDRYVLC